MDMDSGSWLHGYATTNAGGNNGFMCGYAASSCSPAELQYMEDEQQPQQFLISSQIQHHLNQISMRMNMDDEAAVYMSSNDGAATIDMRHDPIVEGLLDDPHHAGTCSIPSSSSSSSLSLPASASLSSSPESSSAHILAAPAAAGGGCNQQYPEVSSHVPLLPPPPPLPPVVPSYDHQYNNLHAAAPAPESPAKTTVAEELNERLTTLGIAVNLVTTYLTGTMQLGNAESGNVVVTNFMGTSFMLLCLLGGFVADSFLGRYLNIAIFTAVQATVSLFVLMLAAMHGKIDYVLKLLQAGANNPAVAQGTSPKPPTGKRGPSPIQQAGCRPRDLAVASQTIMASVAVRRSVALVLLVVALSVTGAAAGSNKSLNITNHCSYTVWPGILSGAAAGSAAALDSTGFELAPGESRSVSVPSGWSGNLWGRTLCSTAVGTGKFTCVTGDCGSGKQDCAGGGPTPPVSLAEFTMDGSGGMDFYDVSLVDGFNLPMLVAPHGAAPGGNCVPTGCVRDLNDGACPAELRVSVTSAAGAVACKSACQAFGSPHYCCTGAYETPDTCKPSAYSELFKKACPLAVSYAYDGAASIFTCGGGDTIYTISFCASTISGAKSSSPNSQPLRAGDLPHVDVTVVAKTGGNQLSSSLPGVWWQEHCLCWQHSWVPSSPASNQIHNKTQDPK